MKILYLSLSILVLATGCDSPQRNRMPGQVIGNGLGQPVSTDGSNPWGTVTPTTTGSTSGSTSGSTTLPSTRPEGFENCQISATHYAPVIGYMGICQSTLDETSVAINTTLADSKPTCLIPTFKDTSGSSTYLGDPQCFIPVANDVKLGKVYKTRTGFKEPNVTFMSLPINGVMIMKQQSLTAYYTCMDAFVKFRHPSCPTGATYNDYCRQMAMSYMSTICNDFKSNNPYLDIRLK